MEKVKISNKTKAIVYLIITLTIFSLGAFARPGIDISVALASSVFKSNEKQYIAPPSEYEVAVEELWQSKKHQDVCRANAAATVALQLAKKYLQETEKQTAMSNYDLPISEAVEKTKEARGR